MQPIQLFHLAAKQAHWLSVRQDVVAGNVANVNTPGYRAMDVEPFADVLAKEQTAMAATNPAHFGGVGSDGTVKVENVADDTVEIKPSGNSVTLAEELIKTGDIRREFQLNVNVVRAFQGMMMSVVSK
ncbi:MAG: flagellar basal body rod protein FlgB [Pararhizobium sp.]